MKVKFCRRGGVPPSLLNAMPLMAPIKKVTNMCGSALTIMTRFIMQQRISTRYTLNCLQNARKTNAFN